MMTEVIQGWQQGIRLIGVGGEIRLIIPSTMAYRDRLVGTLPPTTNNPLPGPLPANSILDFDIKLIAINPKPVQPN
jgi:FKBP-type peptidyl-prolyl cis-trans isomerase FkpA